MKLRLIQLSLFFILFISFSCNGQNDRDIAKNVGGPCEGCEALLEYGDMKLSPLDTLPLFAETEPKLKISGTVYEHDGKTPAKDVILYIYHTNREGIYQKKGDEKGWAGRHGFIRGWAKTDNSGRYTFYTFRPASYPKSSEPAHIHLTIKESGTNEYYLDDFVFEDDPHLTKSKRTHLQNRGGSGIMKPVTRDGMLYIERDIVLGLNIPGY